MKRFIGVYDYTVILTYISLLSGIFGMMLAGNGYYGWAVACVFFSGFCDAFDGAIARTKKNRTEDEKNFGIQIDSLCDIINFGVVPAYICYEMGVDGVLGTAVVFFFALCALIRLAFFNVLEAKRQKVEEGKNKYYRGLPVTAISIIFPIVYFAGKLITPGILTIVLHIMLVVVGFLFILDFQVRKPDWDRFVQRKRV